MTEYGLVPYDLTMPPSMGIYHTLTRKHDTTEVKVGGGEDAGTLVKTHWHACKDGCCKAGDVYRIRVPCDRVPHCNACECSSEHVISLSETDLRAIKGLLP